MKKNRPRILKDNSPRIPQRNRPRRVQYNTIFALFLIALTLFLLPYSLWKGLIDSDNIEKRGIRTKAVIVDENLVGNCFYLEYVARGNRVTKSFPKLFHISKSIGDQVYILYDSLDVKNIMYCKN